MIQEFNAAIPGESLTVPPGSRPYERPPEITDPEEAIQMHLTRLSKEDMMQDIADALDLGLDVVTLTEGILRSAVAEGIHSIDTSLIIAPVVHEFIKKVGDAAGVEYEEGLVDKKAEAEKRRAITTAKAKKLVQKKLKDKKSIMPTSAGLPQDSDIPMDPAVESEVPVDTPEAMPEPEGFMKRRGVNAGS